MFNKKDNEQKVAKLLLQIKAIKMQLDHPFIWESGWKSPIHFDSHVTLSHPTIRTHIRQKLTLLVQEEFGSITLVAGVTNSGIPQGILVAQELGLPFVNVNPNNFPQIQVENDFLEGQRVVIIDDLISTGLSNIAAVEALRHARCDVAGLVSIFNYGIELAEQNFKNAKCRFASLCHYDSLVEYIAENHFIAREELKSLYQWKENPSEWGNTLILN